MTKRLVKTQESIGSLITPEGKMIVKVKYSLNVTQEIYSLRELSSGRPQETREPLLLTSGGLVAKQPLSNGETTLVLQDGRQLTVCFSGITAHSNGSYDGQFLAIGEERWRTEH